MNDITFIVPPQNRDWVLDRIAKEIAKRHDGKTEINYRYQNVIPAKAYFMVHYSILPEILHFNPWIKPSECVVFFTHTSSDLSTIIPALNKAKAVVAENPFYYEELLLAGLDEKILHMVPEASDPEIFKKHERTADGAILVSGSYRRRKNFETILKIIEIMPERKFIVVTQLIEKWEKFQEMVALPNVEILSNVPYARYPEIYGNCSVYLSCSTVEGGGPNSLIEAMHANIVPVVTDVGNAREFIMPGSNGYILDVEAGPEQFKTAIQKAYRLNADVSESVSAYTWDFYAESMLEIILPEKYLDENGEITKYALQDTDIGPEPD